MDAVNGGYATVKGGTLHLANAEKLNAVTVASQGMLLADAAVSTAAIVNAGTIRFASSASTGGISNTGRIVFNGTTTAGNILNAQAGLLPQKSDPTAGIVVNTRWAL